MCPFNQNPGNAMHHWSGRGASIHNTARALGDGIAEHAAGLQLCRRDIAMLRASAAAAAAAELSEGVAVAMGRRAWL